MEKCVVTLPITPTTNPSFGMIASIIASDIIARNFGLKLVLALGVQGMRISAPDRESVVSAFLSQLRNVGVKPDFVLMGDSKAAIKLIGESLGSLLKQGRITTARTNILVCPCGAVEKLADAKEPYEKRRLYETLDGQMFCKICGKLVQEKAEQVHLFELPGQISGMPVYPEFYHSEIDEQIRNASGSRVLVSRTRTSSVPVRIGGSTILFDPDFVWQAYLATLPRVGLDPFILVCSNHTLRAAILTRAVQEVCLPETQLNLVIPPYFLGDGRQHLGKEEYSMDVLTKAHHKNSLRVLAGESLNWNQKESIIQMSQLPLLDRMNSRFESLVVDGEVMFDFPSFFQRCNHRKIREAVRSVRGNRGIEDTSSLFGVVDH